MKVALIKILLITVASFFALQTQAAAPSGVVINEVAWMGTTVSHADEWIELYNNTGSEIILDGWVLKSTDDTPTINLEDVLLSNSFFLLERTDETTVASITANQIYTGALGNSGEYLKLFDADGNLIDEINASSGWPAGDNSTKQTMERFSDGWQTSNDVGGTPGAQNSIYEPSPPPPPDPKFTPPPPNPELTPPINEPNTTTTPPQSPPYQGGETETATTTDNGEETAQQITYPSNIFINEIMPSPTGADDEQEWIELINTNNERVDISLWKIRDTAGAINTHTFPQGTTVDAHAYLVLSRPTTRITLNNDGDGLELVRPDEKIAQSVLYGKAPKGKSYTKNIDQWQWSDVPTPGSANILWTTAYSPPTTVKKETADARRSAADSPVVGSPLSVSSPENLASIGSSVELGTNSRNSNLVIYILAPILALFSAIFIFLLKKRLQRP